MYSQLSGGGLSNKGGVPILDIDIFGVRQHLELYTHAGD